VARHTQRTPAGDTAAPDASPPRPPAPGLRPAARWRWRCVNERFHYTANLHLLDGRDRAVRIRSDSEITYVQQPWKRLIAAQVALARPRAVIQASGS
jgi:hypothetical protein